jgi:hypothetical protein
MNSENAQKVHYVSNDPIPDCYKSSLCGQIGVPVVWKLAQVTCEACQQQFARELNALRAEWRRAKHQGR